MSYPPTKKAFLLRVSLGDVHLIFCLAGYKCMYIMNGYFLHIVVNYKNGVLQTVTPFKNYDTFLLLFKNVNVCINIMALLSVS